MKKEVFISIFGLFILAGCYTQQKENDLAIANLKGNVKSVKELSFKAKDEFGRIIKGDRARASDFQKDVFILYNKSGNRIEDNRYNRDDSLHERYTFIYDDKDRLIEENWFARIDRRFLFKYDENNYLVERNWFDPDGSLKRKTIYHYNEKGNLTEESAFNSDGSLNSKYTFEYDLNGNRIKERWYDHTAKPIGIIENKYDRKGNLTEIINYSATGELIRTEKYTYDRKGNPLEEAWYNREGKQIRFHTYTYQYDSRGNWTKRIEFNFNVPVFVVTREIDYFD